MRFENIKEASDYAYTQLREVNPDISKEGIYDSILDEVIQSSEYSLSDADLEVLNQHIEDSDFTDTYLQSKVSDLSELLSDIVLDMVADEILMPA